MNSRALTGAKGMRCYFMRDGPIQAVEELSGLLDDEAVEKSHELFAAKPRGQFDGFEVWDPSAR